MLTVDRGHGADNFDLLVPQGIRTVTDGRLHRQQRNDL
jgi:hypothetical protein